MTISTMSLTSGELTTVRIGSRVRVQDFEGEEEYEIVGREEAEPIRRRISNESPLAQALLGRSTGDQVKVRAPGGLRAVTILAVAY